MPSSQPTSSREEPGAVELVLVNESFPVPVADEPQIVFDHWVATMKSKSAVRCVFSDKRRRLISRRLDEYDLATCLAAIDGCAASDFHMGQNSRNRAYNSIELIFRDAEHVERFAEIGFEQRAPQGDFEQPTNNEVDW